MNLNIERISRIRWQCRRGMLELDTLLQSFFDQEFNNLSFLHQNDFERLLKCSDQSLFCWFLGRELPADPSLAAMVKRIITVQSLI